MLIFLILNLFFIRFNAIIYDCYTGKPATRSRIEVYQERNNTQYCIIDAKPCDPNDWRRVDGSCNNLKHPSFGMSQTPTIRILPPVFSKDYDPRKTKDNKDLPIPRVVRYQTLMEGKASDLHITQLFTFSLLFAVNDILSINDIINYLTNTTNCCTEEGKSNYICSPNEIPIDDAVHRYSGVRCMNLTRPQSFQYFGCADFGSTEFARILFTTSAFDLSTIYSSTLSGINDMRTFENGLLKEEIENGKIFPPSDPKNDSLCFLNQVSKGETRCHKYQQAGVLGPNLMTLLYYRQHNYFARQLAKLNPCWDDELLFNTAKDINIAVHMNIYLYELLPVILGRKNMIKEGLISCDRGFRDLYKEAPPQNYEEFIFIYRFFHTIQEPELKLFDTEGHFLKKVPMVNLTARIGYLPLDNHLEELYQCSFRQLGAKFDHTVDNEMSERIFGGLQFSGDGQANHVNKGRMFGFPPYVKYREHFTNRSFKTFDSLKDFISKERLYRLSELYDDVEDIDLIAAAWSEKHKSGARVPDIVYHIFVQQIKRILASDRHWHERPNRPHAFTKKQLASVTKSTIAGVLCINAEGVTEIQPKAFYKISYKNPLTNCNSSKIGKVDLSAWKDKQCEATN